MLRRVNQATIGGKGLRAEKPTVQKRIFIAFSDLAILIALKNQAMTGYGVNNYFMKKVGDAASPSTVYANLASLERKGCIVCIRNMSGRVYALTGEGKKIADEMPESIKEIEWFINKLLKN